MRICLLTDVPEHPLLAATEALLTREGHIVEHLPPGGTAAPAPLADVYLLKAGTPAALAAARRLEGLGGQVVNSAVSTGFCQDRAHMARLARRAGLPFDRSLTRRLRTARPICRPNVARRPTGRGVIRGMVSVSTSPAEVEDLAVMGHREGDLVMGTRPSAVATLVERTSRYPAIVALPDGIKAEQVAPHLTRSLLGIPPSCGGRSPGTVAAKWPSRPSPSRPECRSTSASRGARGSEAPEPVG